MRVSSILAATIAPALLAFACTTATTSTVTQLPAIDAGTKPEAGALVEDAATMPPPSGRPPHDAGPKTCADEEDSADRFACCALEHHEGLEVHHAAVVACYCTDATCKSECADSICAPPPNSLTAACEACADQHGVECGAQMEAACAASADCTAFQKCIQKTW